MKAWIRMIGTRCASSPHQIADTAINHTLNVRQRPVWQDMPENVRVRFTTSAPQDPTPLPRIVEDVKDTVFEVGCALVRDEAAHLASFSISPEYLKPATRGVAAAAFLHDYGIQTSRGFRALKVWMSLREHGVKKFGCLIDQDITKAAYLTNRIEQSERLHLLCPTNINLVCFLYDPGIKSKDELKALNIEIMLRLQEEGTAVLSDTTVHGSHCLRAAINNHRTLPADLDLLVEETLHIGNSLCADR